MQRETAANSPLQLLVAEDSEDDFEILLRELRRGGYVVTAQRVKSPAELDAALELAWDLVISDWIMPGFGGLQVLESVSARGLDLACIIVSGTPGEEPAVEALRAGALDFLSKDKPRRIVPAVQRALREAEDRRARLRVERELRLSEERYRTGFELAPEPLLAYDLDRRVILDANAKATELFRCSLAELRSLDLGALSPVCQPDGRTSAEALAHYTGRALAGESPAFEWVFESHAAGGDDARGELIPTDTRIVNLATAGRSIAQINIIDLRERVRAEEMRRRSAELETQNRRIQEASRLKSEFLANMSHELRTPLNAIIGFTELLHDGQVDPSSPVHREFLGDILASGRHLLQLINDVLDLAKVEAGKLEFRPELVEVTKLVNEVSAILRTIVAQKQIRLSIEIDPRIETLTIDPPRLKQVAYNYLSNALKFTPIGGVVTLRIKDEGERFRLEVEDTGIGIKSEDVGRLFIEFQQLEAGSAKRHQGTGLGLALTRRLVEGLGGSVGVRSLFGVGSTFHATLPKHAIAVGRAPTPVVIATGRAGAPTILVVEDDVRDQAQFVSALESAGYTVDLAATGHDAISRWQARHYDAATIDLLLPDMSGLELLAALRDVGTNTQTPIIVVTVVPDTKLVAGFTVHDILHKPVDREILLASLTRAGVDIAQPEHP